MISTHVSAYNERILGIFHGVNRFGNIRPTCLTHGGLWDPGGVQGHHVKILKNGKNSAFEFFQNKFAGGSALIKGLELEELPFGLVLGAHH